MKKFIALLVIVLVAFIGVVLVNVFGGASIDYDNPLQASNAYESGTDLNGKVISVECNLYFKPDEYMGKHEIYRELNTKQLYYVKVYVNSASIKKGDEVKVKVSSVNRIDSKYLYIMGDVVD